MIYDTLIADSPISAVYLPSMYFMPDRFYKSMGMLNEDTFKPVSYTK